MKSLSTLMVCVYTRISCFLCQHAFLKCMLGNRALIMQCGHLRHTAAERMQGQPMMVTAVYQRQRCVNNVVSNNE